jgi:hypothetical protein
MTSSRTGVDPFFFQSEDVRNLEISGSEEDVLEAAVQLAVRAHGHRDTPALREELRFLLRDARKNWPASEASSAEKR